MKYNLLYDMTDFSLFFHFIYSFYNNAVTVPSRMFDKGIRGYLQIFYKLIISFLFNTSNVQTETLFKIQTEKSAELTCCTGQYPEATHVWRECAV